MVVNAVLYFNNTISEAEHVSCGWCHWASILFQGQHKVTIMMLAVSETEAFRYKQHDNCFITCRTEKSSDLNQRVGLIETVSNVLYICSVHEKEHVSNNPDYVHQGIM